MKVNEEIDALENDGPSVRCNFGDSKFLAMVLMLPCLTIWANFMGIIGGSVFGMYGADFTWLGYMHASLNALFLRDITTGLIKSVMFGMTITAVGCFEGLATGTGAESGGEIQPLRGWSCLFFWWWWWIWCSPRCSFSLPAANFQKGKFACQRPSISPRP